MVKLIYRAQRYPSWAWLDTDVQFETDGPEWALNAYGSMEAVLKPGAGSLVAEDGRPVFEERGTLIHADSRVPGGFRRWWTGIVVESELRGSRWHLRIDEWPGFLDGLPVTSKITGVNADPATLCGQILHRGRLDVGGLDVSVVGSTPIRVGSTSSNDLRNAKAALVAAEAALKAASTGKSGASASLATTKKTYAALVAEARAQVAAQQKTISALVSGGASPSAIDAAVEELDDRLGLLNDALASYNSVVSGASATVVGAKATKSAAQITVALRQNEYDAAVEAVKFDGGEYVVDPLDLRDSYEELRQLALYGFDWTTGTTYATGAPVLSLNVHHPAAGAVRDDLVFEQGVNVVSELALVAGGEYANVAYGRGQGEGEGALRWTELGDVSRMVRPVIVEDKSIRYLPQLKRLCADALRLAGEPYVEEITVRDCVQTPIGSWNVGDHIRLVGRIPNVGKYSRLHRIVSWRMAGPGVASIRLELSAEEV